MYVSSDGMTPVPGPHTPNEDLVAIPFEDHNYVEFRDIGSGYWINVCYTCNRYFGFQRQQAHLDYFERAARLVRHNERREAGLQGSG